MEITTLKNFDWKKSRDKKNVLKTVALFDKWLKEDDKRGLKRINAVSYTHLTLPTILRV